MKRRRRNALVGYVILSLALASAAVGAADVLMLMHS
jgi:hypothetical protein